MLTVHLLEDPIPYLVHLQAVLEKNPELWAPYLNTTDAVSFTRDGTFNLWVGHDGDALEMYALTEVAIAPRAKVVTVVWCGGQKVEKYFPKFFSGVETYAKVIEADRIHIHGRLAWKRLLRPLGYEFFQVSLMKKVERDEPETAFESHTDDEAGA